MKKISVNEIKFCDSSGHFSEYKALFWKHVLIPTESQPYPKQLMEKSLSRNSQIPSSRRPGLMRDAAKNLIHCDSGSSGDESQEDSAYNAQCCFSPPVNKFWSFFLKSSFLGFETILGNCIQFQDGSQLYFYKKIWF